MQCQGSCSTWHYPEKPGGRTVKDVSKRKQETNEFTWKVNEVSPVFTYKIKQKCRIDPTNKDEVPLAP